MVVVVVVVAVAVVVVTDRYNKEDIGPFQTSAK